MRKYLSFGGGVNSVALYLYLVEQGEDFEAVFVHHGTDWPETYDYVAGFQWWLKREGLRPITILRPDVNTLEGVRFSSLYDYYKFKRIFPIRVNRACTDNFKRKPINKYISTPCFMFIGIDAGESHRATISYENGIEKRYPLVEEGIDRSGCVKIIENYGLKAPPKSGCFICPFQSNGEFKRLRVEEPCLFRSAVDLEKNAAERKISEGKRVNYIKNKPLDAVVNENQMQIFEQDEYPPCQCGL